MFSCQNNSNNSYTERKAMHEPYGWTIFTNCSFEKKKGSLIITEEKTVLKNCVKN